MARHRAHLGQARILYKNQRDLYICRSVHSFINNYEYKLFEMKTYNSEQLKLNKCSYKQLTVLTIILNKRLYSGGGGEYVFTNVYTLHQIIIPNKKRHNVN